MANELPGRDPKWQPPIAIYPLLCLLLFVFLHSLTPADFRIRMGFKRFDPELTLAPLEIWYSIKKWRHILWFALFFPLVRSLFRHHATRKGIFAVLIVSFLIEFEECFTAGRHGRLVDVLPNLIGTLVGAVVWQMVLKIWSNHKWARNSADKDS
jgi:VanZ family protein